MWLDRNNPKEFVVATVRACRVATIPCRNVTPDLWGRGYGAEIGAAPSLGVRERPRFYRPSRLAKYEHLTGMRLAQAAASCTGRGLKNHQSNFMEVADGNLFVADFGIAQREYHPCG